MVCVHQIPLSSAFFITPPIAFSWEVNPLRMAKLRINHYIFRKNIKAISLHDTSIHHIIYPWRKSYLILNYVGMRYLPFLLTGHFITRCLTKSHKQSADYYNTYTDTQTQNRNLLCLLMLEWLISHGYRTKILSQVNSITQVL